jgi:hypothetical protein
MPRPIRDQHVTCHLITRMQLFRFSLADNLRFATKIFVNLLQMLRPRWLVCVSGDVIENVAKAVSFFTFSSSGSH